MKRAMRNLKPGETFIFDGIKYFSRGKRSPPVRAPKEGNYFRESNRKTT